jgi:hypothetical protein
MCVLRYRINLTTLRLLDWNSVLYSLLGVSGAFLSPVITLLILNAITNFTSWKSMTFIWIWIKLLLIPQVELPQKSNVVKIDIKCIIYKLRCTSQITSKLFLESKFLAIFQSTIMSEGESDLSRSRTELCAEFSVNQWDNLSVNLQSYDIRH